MDFPTREELPAVNRIAVRIATLERKAEHLENRLASGQGSRTSLEFDRSELLAVEEGIRALKLHQAFVEKQPHAFEVLKELVALDLEDSAPQTLRRVIAKAEQVLEEFRGFGDRPA